MTEAEYLATERAYREEVNRRSRERRRERYASDPAYRMRRLLKHRARTGHLPAGTLKTPEVVDRLLEWNVR